VKAGSRDCPGTGIAHYFEHIMFKGTGKIGTLDYAAEKPYLDSIAVLYDRLAEVPEEERAAIQKEINRLNIAASAYAVPNEFDNLISACGGSGLNAYTSTDVTVYHNEFIPAYFEQWAELNSERLIDPVFRLFQGELETVYEEKNRSESNELSAFSQALQSEGYKGSPYEFPIIGTTENLKTPRLSQMADFFERYYVANNMGLMLTGDIDAEKALPVLERTFGRIRPGDPKREAFSGFKPFEGRREVSALVKVPVIKISALCFRGPSRKDADCLPMSLMAFMLNNSEGIGLLDKLTTDKQLLAAICMYPDIAFEEAGLFPVLILPKLLFQKYTKAEGKVLSVLEQIKKGDFTEEFFESCKMTYRRTLVTQIEGLSGRMGEMVDAYAQGRSWDEVLAQIEAIDALTKADMVALANKYFTEDQLVIRKKYGDPDKDDLPKPPYDKIAPKNDVSSEYAIALRAEAEKVELPRVTFDYDSAFRRTEVRPLATLYSVDNPLNDVFELRVRYPVSTIAYPNLDRVASYLSLIGTESMGYEEHRAALQALGGSVGVTAARYAFIVNITGFDKNFEETVRLVADLLEHPGADSKKISIIKQNEMTDKLMSKRDLDALGGALVQYLTNGDKSSYLLDKGKLESGVLLSTLKEVLGYECDIHYSGTLSDGKVAAVLAETLIPERERKAHPFFDVPDITLADRSGVYFIPKKKSPQTRINAFVLGDPMADMETRFLSNVAGQYFGGGMGSVLFQEIREFRSMAYSTSGSVVRQSYRERERVPAYLSTYVGTQGDKTIDAMTVLDSLIQKLPLSERRFEMTVKDVWSNLVTSYPQFRDISMDIAGDFRNDIHSDPLPLYYDLLGTMTMKDVEDFWKKQVEGRPIVWAVVGDPDKIGMENLAKFGTVTQLKPGDVMK
jgi:predicted Zn-dependent peptidase